MTPNKTFPLENLGFGFAPRKRLFKEEAYGRVLLLAVDKV